MLSVIIAAGALFTAVYDVLYRYTTTNTTILNAATVDKTGETFWTVDGTVKNGNENTTFKFAEATWMVVFWGQNGSSYPQLYRYGNGAICIAFYKGNQMNVQIGVDNGIGGRNNTNGGGKTVVETNFAKPLGYESDSYHNAIASGGGGGYQGGASWCVGTFAGKYDGRPRDGFNNGDTSSVDFWYAGGTATQTHGGYRYDGEQTPARNSYGGTGGADGGAGYFDGGGGSGVSWAAVGGGGSCTPWCYPMFSGDTILGARFKSDHKWAGQIYCGDVNKDLGGAMFFRISGTSNVNPKGKEKTYGDTAQLTAGAADCYDPVGVVNFITGSEGADETWDCNIHTGWVYSCSEDGEKWGASSDDLVSVSETKHLAQLCRYKTELYQVTIVTDRKDEQ